MPGRITPLATGEIYHVYNRGSDKRDIFTQYRDFKRFNQTFHYYQFQGPKPKFSNFTKSKIETLIPTLGNKLVEILCYCLMPNHFHFTLKQLEDNGIPIFVSQLSNSYTKYFNTKHPRVGPLLQGAYKAVLVESDAQLIHLSRYIHINPVVSGIVKHPEDYSWSSYLEYLYKPSICETDLVLGQFPSAEEYKKFAEAQIDYGTTLEIIKHQIVDEDY